MAWGIGFWEMVLIGAALVTLVGIVVLVMTVFLAAKASKRDDRPH